MIVAQFLFRIGKRAAGIGIALHHVVVIHPDQDHDRCADKHGKYRSQRTGHRQEQVAGHNEGTPSYGASKRQRPGSQRGQIALQSRLVFAQRILLRIIYHYGRPLSCACSALYLWL